MFELAVIICTRNPNPGRLQRVLSALEAQTLDKQLWQLVIVDNNSDDAVSERFDLQWHPNGMHLLEAEVGLSPARVSGIRNTNSNLIIFVDDDNVLEKSYLETATEIGRNFPFLATWGGDIAPEFEIEPAKELIAYTGALAIRRVLLDRWSNNRTDWSAIPFGAGLCVRRPVADKYASEAKDNKLRNMLDRRGTSLMGGGDIDLVWSSLDEKTGCGLFKDLKLIHLIPKNRCQIDYLLKVTEGNAVGGHLLEFIYSGTLPSLGSPIKVLALILRHLIRLDFTNLKFQLAFVRAEKEAFKIAKNNP